VTLADLSPGQSAIIAEVHGDPQLRARLLALGLRTGREVAVIRRAWLGGPLQVRIGSTDLAMRRQEAHLIRIHRPADGP
jgi:ferrous iron transport protein A